jgi:hypothetical protein
MKQVVRLAGFNGFGDALYLRPTIKAMLAMGLRVEIATSWHLAFHDLVGERCKTVVASHAQYLCQHREAAAEAAHMLPAGSPGARLVRIDYGADDRRAGRNLIQAFRWRVEQAIGMKMRVDEGDVYLPPIPHSAAYVADLMRRTRAFQGADGKPIAILRPPTLRGTWCKPRNPDHGVWQRAARAVRAECFTLRFSDINKEERFDGPETQADIIDLFDGEHMTLGMCIEMFRAADAVLCSPSMALVLSIATRANALCVYGGHAAPKWLQLADSKVEAVAPHPFCDCWHKGHECPPKDIPDETLLPAVQRLVHEGRARRALAGQLV